MTPYVTNGSTQKLKGLLDQHVEALGGDPEKAQDFTILSTPESGSPHRPRILICVEVASK